MLTCSVIQADDCFTKAIFKIERGLPIAFKPLSDLSPKQTGNRLNRHVEEGNGWDLCPGLPKSISVRTWRTRRG